MIRSMKCPYCKRRIGCMEVHACEDTRESLPSPLEDRWRQEIEQGRRDILDEILRRSA